MTSAMLIIAETAEAQIAPVVLEMIAFARKLQGHRAAIHLMLYANRTMMDAAGRLAEEQGIDITLLATTTSQTAAQGGSAGMEMALALPPLDLIRGLAPRYICLAHTAFGLNMAPALAAALDAACVTGVLGLISQGEQIAFVRSLFNDKITAAVAPRAKTTVLTVAPGVFKPEPIQPETSGHVFLVNAPEPPEAVTFRGIQKTGADTSALDAAEVIVAAGNGVKNPDDLDLIYQLSRIFPKSAVAGSRPVCDKKWLKYSQQVGVTGATVKPKLYIACGISGASQHVMGMQNARMVVAVNTDPHAAICNHSDICVIEDLTRFIPHLINLYLATKTTGEANDAGPTVR